MSILHRIHRESISTLNPLCRAAALLLLISFPVVAEPPSLVLVSTDNGPVTVGTKDGRLFAVSGKESTSYEARSARRYLQPAACNGSGSLLVAVSSTNGSSSRIELFEMSGLRFQDPVVVSSGASRYGRFPSLAVSPKGDVWVAWVDGAMASDDILVSHGRNGRFEPPARVSARDETEDLVPQIALDGGGNPLVIWAGSDGHDDEIYFSRLVDGTFTKEARLHPDNSFPDITPALARDQKGVLHACWSGFDGKGYRVFYAAFDGSWSRPMVLSQPDRAATLPTIGPLVSGAVAAWNQFDGKRSVIAAISVSPSSPPVSITLPGTIPASFRPSILTESKVLKAAVPAPDGAAVRSISLSR